MFTGLIEAVGTVVATEARPAGRELRVAVPFAADLQLGESVAVSGVCLTVVASASGQMVAEVGPETMRVTTLGGLRAGDRVNLERAMRGDSRFGGHFVQGHVDGLAELRGHREEGDAHWLTFGFDRASAAYVIPKGSIAIDGISLTVAALGDDTFDVMIVPFTWAHTTLAARAVGDRVNLEFDMVGKYVARAAELARAAGGGWPSATGNRP